MEIAGKVHCFFEQSGTFKNEFRKLGFEASDHDIKNEFGQTDEVCDLFAEIENAYNEQQSIFDGITPDDLIMAFFPCIYFCDTKTMMFRGVLKTQKEWELSKIVDENIKVAQTREYYFETLLKLVSVALKRELRLIIENPWNTSQSTYLQNNFFQPALIDHNRMLRGDYFVKPTAYWYFNCEPTYGMSIQNDKEQRIINKQNKSGKTGECSTERSLISPDYARNFICDFILGKTQKHTQQTLF